MVNVNVIDISCIVSFQFGINIINLMCKELLFDLEDLGIELDNLEGIILGFCLLDGFISLIVISDDNFSGD